MSRAETVHACAAKIGSRGVLIRGAAGSGKSSLLLQILDADRDRNALVADDRVVLRVEDGRLRAEVPTAIAGLMEIRGQGIVRLAYVSPAEIDLVVDVVPLTDCPRMPSATERSIHLQGIALPRIFVAGGAGDGAARVNAALRWTLHENA